LSHAKPQTAATSSRAASSKAASSKTDGEQRQDNPQAARPIRVVWGVRTFVLTALFVAALTTLGVYQVWLRYEEHRMGMALSTQTLRFQSLLDENKQLRTELATLKSPERIRRDAQGRLRMHVPAPQDIVEIR